MPKLDRYRLDDMNPFEAEPLRCVARFAPNLEMLDVNQLPETADLPFRPLQLPGGRNVIINHIYQLDPDDDLVGRRILCCDPTTIIDP